jgi:hypothetical protein
MAKPLKSLARPDAGTLRELAGADPSIPPAVMPSTGSEVVNFRVASSVVDQLDAAADAEGTTRKVIITRALAQAGFRIPQPDLEDRTPRRRRDRREAA